jgi:hypothetical protein
MQSQIHSSAVDQHHIYDGGLNNAHLPTLRFVPRPGCLGEARDVAGEHWTVPKGSESGQKRPQGRLLFAVYLHRRPG